jgi:hypothetical protein
MCTRSSLSRAMLFCLVIATAVVAQNADTTRRLWDTAFIKPTQTKATQRKTKRRAYRVVTPNVPVDNVAPETVVGVTIWRLRPAKTGDAGERLIVHGDSESWVPERISAGTMLAPGDRIRISIEAARSGYLYVIDREQYADGSLGPPFLIFPTTRVLNGENKVMVGRLTEIPAQQDDPPYFTLTRSRPEQVAEVVSVLISPTPIEGLEIGEKAMELSSDQVARWEKSWSSGTGLLEFTTGVGQSWTKEEKEATATGTRALSADSPAPQLLFYRPSAKPSEPMFVKLQLRYRTRPRR